MTAGEIAAVKDIDRVLGEPLPRISLPDYDYTGAAANGEPVKPAVRVNRGGQRMGSRSTAKLSAEELEKLLKVG
jgi:hypothetical protein